MLVIIDEVIMSIIELHIQPALDVFGLDVALAPGIYIVIYKYRLQT